mmetsp:Transcript_96698/g.268831  ORF Transcript_96698/g.268831 Transcript_96698/m.268831 type:complete len:219 (+) Transcript_96698:361-1017(+)
MKACPTALQTAKIMTLLNIAGLSIQKRYPGQSSPIRIVKIAAVSAMYRFVKNCISKFLSFMPLSARAFLSRFCVPPTIPSHANAATRRAIPAAEDGAPGFDFFAMLTATVPPTMSKTCKYSRKLYFAFPSSSEPIITGTILEDFPRVATGNEMPATMEAVVQYLAVTCNAPLTRYGNCGTARTPSKTSMQTPPKMTFATASRTWRNQEYLNRSPVADV